MTDDFLQQLAAGPLADPNKVFLPRGRRKGQHKRSPDELDDFRKERAAKKARLTREAAEHLAQLFAHYATTDIPVERVASNMGITVETARAGLTEFGRAD